MTQCTAHSKSTGKRCTCQAIRGGTVCRVHGGAAPQVKASAALRLAGLVNPSIVVLDRTLKNGKRPDLALNAAKDVLDRNGFRPPDKHQFELNLNDLTDEQLYKILDRLEGESRRLRLLGAGTENTAPPGTDSIQ